MNRQLQHFLDLIVVVTQKDLRVRYKNSFLGYFWSLANPLAYALVYYFAFKLVIRIKIEAYPLFLITALFAWQWFTNSVTLSTTVFLRNASLIKKVNFPRNIIVFAQVLQDMVHFIIAIPVIVLFKFLFHSPLQWSWLYGIPLLLVVQYCFAYGLAVLFASLNLFFRDLERMVSVLVTLCFYLTPIIYSEHLIPAPYRPYIVLNPLAPLMLNWRNVLLYGHLDLGYLALAAVYAVVLLLVGQLVYRRLSWKFAEIL
jgi:lipopolysaccharide transport system permease protein